MPWEKPKKWQKDKKKKKKEYADAQKLVNMLKVTELVSGGPGGFSTKASDLSTSLLEDSTQMHLAWVFSISNPSKL